MTSKILLVILGNLAVMVVSSFVLYVILRERLAYKITKRLLRRGAPNTKARVAKGGQGFNPANVYFTLNYDCRKDDVEIRGVVLEGLYWSLVPYDRYTLPLKSYLTDESVITDDEGRYTVRLTTRPQGRPNELDVSASPRGFVIIRNSLVKNPYGANQKVPEVKAVPRMS